MAMPVVRLSAQQEPGTPDSTQALEEVVDEVRVTAPVADREIQDRLGRILSLTGRFDSLEARLALTTTEALRAALARLTTSSEPLESSDA